MSAAACCTLRFTAFAGVPGCSRMHPRKTPRTFEYVPGVLPDGQVAATALPVNVASDDATALIATTASLFFMFPRSKRASDRHPARPRLPRLTLRPSARSARSLSPFPRTVDSVGHGDGCAPGAERSAGRTASPACPEERL